MADLKIAEPVMKVLEAAQCDGKRLVLTGQLDRKLYEDTNKVLLAIGGKWNRAAKAHLFEEDAGPLVEDILETGSYRRVKQDLGQFDTPEDLAAMVIREADIQPGQSVLEPSAGIGRLAKAALAAGAGNLTLCELDPKRVVALRKTFAPEMETARVQLHEADFLTVTSWPSYNRVVMNPPFAKQVDIDHVRHAFRFLLSGGKLVAIMSASVLFRDNAKAREFREWVQAWEGTFTRLPSESFKESGTSVETVMLTISLRELG